MSPATTTDELREIPLGEIHEQDGINPRTDVGDIAELAASIKDRGVLQPIRVRKNGDGYTLVAGKRRLAAATLAGLTTISAVVAGDSDDQDDALDSLIENVQRQDLSPLEEANALAAVRDRLSAKQRSGRQLSKIVKRSDDWVSDRLRLLTLPEPVAAAIDSGAVGLHAMPALSRIAESGPGGADLAAELVSRVGDGDDQIDRRALEEPALVQRAVEDLVGTNYQGTKAPPVGAVRVDERGYEGYRLDALPIADDVKDDLRARWKALPQSSDYSYAQDDSGLKRTCTFGNDDADAAKAYSCLLELAAPGYAGSTSTKRYITDPEFIADRVRLWLERAEKDAKKRANKNKETKAEREAREAQEADEAERAKQEEAEKRKRVAQALAANDDLARTTAEAFRKIKPDDRVVTLVCFAALEGLGWDRVATAGLRYADEQLGAVNHEKATAKYASEKRAGERLRELFDQASTPAELLGITVRAITLAYHADDTPANLNEWQRITLPGADGRGYAAMLAELVDEVAFRAEALPPAVKEAAIAKGQERAERAERERIRREAEDAEADRVVLEQLALAGTAKTTPTELAKLVRGAQAQPSKVALHGVPWLQPNDIKAAVARLEERKHIELAKDGEYYITKAGQAQHDADIKWWRAEGREQDALRALYEDYGDPIDVEREEGPEEAAQAREEIEAQLEVYRQEWADEDAEADTPRPMIVHVTPTEGGDPVEAELQPERQKGRNTRKVIYTESRTAAWVATSRITDLPDDDAAAGGEED